MSKAEDLFKKKIESIERHYSIENLPEDDESFAKLLMFGDRWDDPEVVMKHVDEHPTWWGRYARASKIARQLWDIAKEKMKWFEDDCKDVLEDLIFFENRLAGMTANNSDPTKDKIERRYNLEIKNGEEGLDVIFDLPTNMEQILEYKKVGKLELPPEQFSTAETYGDRVKQYKKLRKELDESEDRLNLAEINLRAFEKRDTMIIQVVSLAKFLVEKDLAVFRGSLLKQSKVKKEVDTHGYENR